MIAFIANILILNCVIISNRLFHPYNVTVIISITNVGNDDPHRQHGDDSEEVHAHLYVYLCDDTSLS